MTGWRLRARQVVVLAFAFAFATGGLLACNGRLDFRTGISDGGGGEVAGPACAIDDDCRLASLHCAAGGGGCVECDSDAHCTGAGLPRCDRTLHRCVACVSKADCPATQNCLAARCTTTCDDSTPSACPAGTSCEDGYCYSCGHDNLTCADVPATPFCLSPPWICAACRTDGDCGASAPRCDPVRHACVRCVTGADCPAAAPFCDPATGACVAA